MTAASKFHLHPSSSSRPPKTPNLNPTHTSTFPNSQNPNPNSTSPPPSLSQEDQFLSRATHITRHELLKRRSFNLKQLSKCYRDHYWGLMEEMKTQYREYYWKYGVSPFKEDHEQRCRELGQREGEGDVGDVEMEVIGENNNGNGNVGLNLKGGFDVRNDHRCLFVGCKLKAMALTSFCHLHILSDAKQKLYKPCGYVIKSAQAGPITCGRPILRSNAPSLCNMHFQKAQKDVTRALKKAGLTVSSSSKLGSKFHVVVAEYVRQIQAKRKAVKKASRTKGVKKEVNVS
ncbi:hypothetical protein M5689_022282 [Euphorbia peplus]|nr:hypothetical protein M5689_022282 [Euphorbia peplus]